MAGTSTGYSSANFIGARITRPCTYVPGYKKGDKDVNPKIYVPIAVNSRDGKVSFYNLTAWGDKITKLFDVQPANDLPSPKSARHPWAQLLKRTFAVDVLLCPKCSSNMKLVEIATTHEAIQKSLAKAALAPMPPPRPLPEVSAQLPLDLGQSS